MGTKRIHKIIDAFLQEYIEAFGDGSLACATNADVDMLNEIISLLVHSKYECVGGEYPLQWILINRKEERKMFYRTTKYFHRIKTSSDLKETARIISRNISLASDDLRSFLNAFDDLQKE